jgi:hypothetical protein
MCIYLRLSSTVHSLIKLKATVSFRLREELFLYKLILLFYGTVIDLYRENPVALGGKSFSSSPEPGSVSCVQVYQ